MFRWANRLNPISHEHTPQHYGTPTRLHDVMLTSGVRGQTTGTMIHWAMPHGNPLGETLCVQCHDVKRGTLMGLLLPYAMEAKLMN